MKLRAAAGKTDQLIVNSRCRLVDEAVYHGDVGAGVGVAWACPWVRDRVRLIRAWRSLGRMHRRSFAMGIILLC